MDTKPFTVLYFTMATSHGRPWGAALLFWGAPSYKPERPFSKRGEAHMTACASLFLAFQCPVSWASQPQAWFYLFSCPSTQGLHARPVSEPRASGPCSRVSSEAVAFSAKPLIHDHPSLLCRSHHALDGSASTLTCCIPPQV